MAEAFPHNIVVIYHANCRDGFSAAYAAWKKFGDEATYLPAKYQEALPEGLADKEVYILDFSYSKEVLTQLSRAARSVVVLDHHESAREAVTSFPQNVFAQDHSGAVLAWHYFHPASPLPRLFAYIEDSDLWRHARPYGKEVGALIAEYDYTFEDWDRLVADMEDEQRFMALIARGKILSDAKERHVRELAGYAEKVLFEGHEVLAVNCGRPYRSDVGNLLAEQHPPFSIVWYHYGGMFHLSLRSLPHFDVASLAEKHGGGGHKNAASIRVKNFEDIPFSFL